MSCPEWASPASRAAVGRCFRRGELEPTWRLPDRSKTVMVRWDVLLDRLGRWQAEQV